MEDYGTSNDHSSDTPETIQREFVLMPLFRRMRERLRPKSALQASEAPSLPPDTYLIYPDRLGNYHGNVDDRATPMRIESTPEPVAISHSVAAAVEPISQEEPELALSSETQTATVPDLSEVTTAATMSEPELQETASPMPALAAQSVPLTATDQLLPKPRREEPIPLSVAAAQDHASEENLNASNLAYMMKRANAPRRTSDAPPPRFTKRQVTVTIPQPNWSALRPNWALLRPALTYGAIGFGTCLLLFLIPGLPRPTATTSVPRQQLRTVSAPEPQPNAQGYTLQAGAPAQQGFTVSPAATPVNPAQATAAKASKPHAAVQNSEPEVVVHHYTAPKPHVMRASSGVKKYSDLD